MDKYIKHFSELSRDELYEIYKIRVAGFVVEQNCPYQEIDACDREAYHVFFKEDGQIIAYARVLPAGSTFEEVSFGRVLTLKRRQGLGTQIVKESIETAKDRFAAEKIVIEAQTYVKKMYADLGFKETSEEFLEDGIPHVRMELDIKKQETE